MQAALHRELAAALGTGCSPSATALGKVPLLRAVVKETLRWGRGHGAGDEDGTGLGTRMRMGTRRGMKMGMGVAVGMGTGLLPFRGTSD